MADSHQFLVLPPLIIISVFCFGFVLAQSPSSLKDAKAAASQAQAPEDKSRTKSTAPSLINQTEVPKLSTVPVANDSSAASSAPLSTPTNTANPQVSRPNTPSSDGASSLQSAANNNQTSSNGGNDLKPLPIVQPLLNKLLR